MKWVQLVKAQSAYDPQTHGAALKIEITGTPFDPDTYQADLLDLSSPAAKQLRFKFRKAYGHIDGVNLYGRKAGATTSLLLGRFTASPGNVLVPLAGTEPEEWEFFARAVKRDVEVGLPSEIVVQIIRG